MLRWRQLCRNRAGGGEIGRSALAVVSAMVVFVVVSLLAFLVTLRFVGGVIWPAVIVVFCGFAAATVLNATDVMARWSRRDLTDSRAGTGGRDDRRENGRIP